LSGSFDLQELHSIFTPSIDHKNGPLKSVLMNNLSPLGLITSFIFAMVLNGTSFSSPAEPQEEPSAYIINNSHSVVYFKPESRDANPGMEPDAAYAIQPGEKMFGPVDAIVTATTPAGYIFRIPTGARLVINEKGIPEPANLVARSGLLLPAYGDVLPPCANFAKLANSKPVLYHLPDFVVSR